MLLAEFSHDPAFSSFGSVWLRLKGCQGRWWCNIGRLWLHAENGPLRGRRIELLRRRKTVDVLSGHLKRGPRRVPHILSFVTICSYLRGPLPNIG
jgi:hypothetical protein